MLYRKIIAVCSEIYIKHINTLCGQNVQFVNVRPGGTYSYHWALKFSNKTDAVCFLFTPEIQNDNHITSLPHICKSAHLHLKHRQRDPDVGLSKQLQSVTTRRIIRKSDTSATKPSEASRGLWLAWLMTLTALWVTWSDVMFSGKYVPTFRKNLLPPFWNYTLDEGTAKHTSVKVQRDSKRWTQFRKSIFEN